MKTATRLKKIAVLIPCHNEAATIADVIGKFRHRELRQSGFVLEIIVIDNNSSDRTAIIGRQCGASVIHEAKLGKGNAMRTGFSSLPADAEYVVMLDGDDTYNPAELIRLVEPLHNHFCGAVTGSRLGGCRRAGSMRRFNFAGNWFYTQLVRWLYCVGVTDVLTGYYAWRREVIDQLVPHLNSANFGLEMEMATKMAKLGHTVFSVPISYCPRASASNLRPLYDGLCILMVLMKNLRWKPLVVRVDGI